MVDVVHHIHLASVAARQSVKQPWQCDLVIYRQPYRQGFGMELCLRVQGLVPSDSCQGSSSGQEQPLHHFSPDQTFGPGNNIAKGHPLTSDMFPLQRHILQFRSVHTVICWLKTKSSLFHLHSQPGQFKFSVNSNQSFEVQVKQSQQLQKPPGQDHLVQIVPPLQ